MFAFELNELRDLTVAALPTRLFHSFIAGCAAAALVLPQTASAQEVDFGNDSSKWAKDGECDDNRFVSTSGPSATQLDSNIKRDATDCRKAYEQGRVKLRADRAIAIIWGDDDSEFARDGECDDMRFEGEGLTSTELSRQDVKRDASDCRTAYETGKIQLRQAPEMLPTRAAAIDFGSDSSRWAMDGECDDRRFEGDGMTGNTMLPEDIKTDATDCALAYAQDRIALRTAELPQVLEMPVIVPIESVYFGDDDGAWVKDNECDDLRFVGKAMAKALTVEAISKDASDCKAAFEADRVRLSALFADTPVIYGDDSALLANNGACGDLRFFDQDADLSAFEINLIGRDASDCRAAVEAGDVTWQVKAVIIEEAVQTTPDAISNSSPESEVSAQPETAPEFDAEVEATS